MEAGEIGELEAQGGEAPLFYQATVASGGRTYTSRQWWRWRQRQPSLPASPSPAPPDDDPVYLPASGSSPTQGQGHAATAAAPTSSLSKKRGRAPASRKAILGLREVTTTTTDIHCSGATCLQDPDSHHAHPDPETPPLRLKAMPFSHTCHQHCVFQWLCREAPCPLCRHQLPTEEDEEQEQGRRRCRIVYDEDGRMYSFGHYKDDPVINDDQEQEQETRTTTTIRSDGYPRLVAQKQLRNISQKAKLDN